MRSGTKKDIREATKLRYFGT